MESQIGNSTNEEMIYTDKVAENNQTSLKRNIEIKNIFLKVIDVILFLYSLLFFYYIDGLASGVIHGEGAMLGIIFIPFLAIVLIQVIISLIRMKKLDLFDKIFLAYSCLCFALAFLYM